MHFNSASTYAREGTEYKTEYFLYLANKLFVKNTNTAQCETHRARSHRISALFFTHADIRKQVPMKPDQAEHQPPALDDNPLEHLFNRSAARFDRPPLHVWSVLAQALLQHIDISNGARVLDLGCGSGAVSLLAAKAAGPHGDVTGIDIAPRMLAHARQRADRRRLANTRFHCADMDSWPPAHERPRFDVVLAGFSLFFSADMPALLQRLPQLTAIGGQWGFSFWADRFFPPLGRQLLDDLSEFGVDVTPEMNAFEEKYGKPDYLRSLFQSAGKTVELHQTSCRFALANYRQWWTLVRHSGLSALLDRLPRSRLPAFRRSHLAHLRQRFGNTDLALTLPVYLVLVRF